MPNGLLVRVQSWTQSHKNRTPRARFFVTLVVYSSSMESAKEYAYGIIPLRRFEEGYQVLLIHQISHSDTHWTFPKGHAESGETPLQTALRELQEETGLTPQSVNTENSFIQEYVFTHEGRRIEKQVTYFVGYIAKDADLLTQQEEILEARWCTFFEARQLLTYDGTRELLDEVEQVLMVG